jgi:Fe-S-cluster containining protein
MTIRTLGELVEQEGILDAVRDVISRINAAAGKEAKAVGKQQRLPAVSCFTCTAKKACCWSVVTARLYEGVVVAGELRRSERDTPELRERLRAAADAMEAADPYGWRVPCVFLDAAERCTVYAARPTACGTLFVYTPPAACNDPAAEIQKYVPLEETAAATELEDQFRERLALRKKVGRRYVGVLPRMVLVALEAWDRTDFRDHLRQLPWPSDDEISRWSRRVTQV